MMNHRFPRSEASRELYACILKHKIPEAIEVLKDHSELATSGYRDAPYLYTAASEGLFDVCREMIKLGADVNILTDDSSSPLGQAVRHTPELVKLFLENGADPRISRPAFSLFSLRNKNQEHHAEIIQLLIDHGLDINRVYLMFDDPNARKTLLDFIGDDHPEVKEILLKNEAKHAKDLPDAVGYGSTDNVVEPPTDQTAPVTSTIQKEPDSDDLPTTHHGALRAYCEDRFGPIKNSIIELIPAGISVQIYVCESDKSITLFTSGMSFQPMPDPPPGFENASLAELFVELPKGWKYQDFTDANSLWPALFLRQAARLPHENGLWMGGPYNILPNNSPDETLSDNNQFTGFLLLQQGKFNSKGEIVRMYRMIPLYWGEIQMEKEQGIENLLAAFKKAGIGGQVDIKRPDVSKL